MKRWYSLIDLTDNKYVTEDALSEYAMDELVEFVGEETSFARCGDDEPTSYVKHGDKYYYIKIEIFWNRHDKQFYYMDGTTLTEFKEVTADQVLKGEV